MWTIDSNGQVAAVSAAHESADGSLIATADDSGVLKLFHCPCVVQSAPYRAGKGHAGAISCVRFLEGAGGDRTLVSSGRSDGAVIRWKVQ